MLLAFTGDDIAGDIICPPLRASYSQTLYRERVNLEFMSLNRVVCSSCIAQWLQYSRSDRGDCGLIPANWAVFF